MDTDLQIKRGDTLAFTAIVKDDTTKEPIDFDIDEIKSQLRDSIDTLIDTFKVTKSETAGEYLFEAQEDTNTYPIDTLEIDIEFNKEGIIQSSQTFTLKVIKDITRAGENDE